MSKVINLSKHAEKLEHTYLEYMTAFWNEYDLYWELSNGGFELWTVYINAGNKIQKSDIKTLAAAANLVIIEYNKERILVEGFETFSDHISLLSQFYDLEIHEINQMSVKLKASTLKVSFDPIKLAWDDEVDEDDDFMDDDDFNHLDEDTTKNTSFMMTKKCNLHVTITLNEDTNTDKDSLIDEIKNIVSSNKPDIFPLNLYSINSDADIITFSIDCPLAFMVVFIEIMQTQYRITPDFLVIRDLDENAFEPDNHYSSFMHYYRDMLTDDIEDDAELNNYLKKYATLSDQERRAQNINAREDDECAALDLFDLPHDESVKKAEEILKTNPHNIESQVLIAGWQGDLEKRIDMLLKAANITNLDYDYIRIQKDKMWWKASHTRPFMRAKYLLSKTYEIGGYIDDAIDLYNELIDMNHEDNLGARLELIRLLYKIDDRKAISTLVNKYPEENDEFFSFAAVYFTFMKYGKSSKTEKKIKASIASNHYLAGTIAKLDTDIFGIFFETPEDIDEKMYNLNEKYADDILPLFKNSELFKYYRKIVKELLDMIDE